jgi:hypothetical protein
MGVLTGTVDGALAEQTGADRRTARRRPLDEIPQISEVKMLSQPVKVVNVSRTGLLMKSTSRLIPGRQTRLRFEGPSLSTWVPSRIARCEVGSLEGGKIVYIVGVVFDSPLAFVDDSHEEPQPEPAPPVTAPPSTAQLLAPPVMSPAVSAPAFDATHMPAPPPAAPAFVEAVVMNDW